VDNVETYGHVRREAHEKACAEDDGGSIPQQTCADELNHDSPHSVETRIRPL
jgi:hypothetical protein